MRRSGRRLFGVRGAGEAGQVDRRRDDDPTHGLEQQHLRVRLELRPDAAAGAVERLLIVFERGDRVAARAGPGAGAGSSSGRAGRLGRLLSELAGGSFDALGTRASVYVTDASVEAAAIAALRREVEAIDLACSRFRDDSEIAAINRAGGRTVSLSELMVAAVGAALDVAAATDGAVTPTVGRALRAIGYDRDYSLVLDAASRIHIRAESVPGWRAVELDRERATVRVPRGVELDLGATAKALCADRAAAAIQAAHGCGVLVNLGGDLAIAGPPPAGGWFVHVTEDHAADLTAPGQTIGVLGGGLATSSTTVRRWHTATGPAHHIVDPRTGAPAREVWRTVSVAARTCVDANAASTAAIVRGDEAAAWLGERHLPSRLVDPAGDVTLVAGWPDEVAA